MRELNTIQEKILDRALFLIGKKGNYDVSVRDITREAGVNVNAINYYFGSKEQMIDQMEEFFIKNYLAAYSVLEEDMDDEEKLLIWANEVIEYNLQYPGIQVILRDNLNSERGGIMHQFLKDNAELFDQKVDKLMRDVLGADEEFELVRMLFNSGIFYPSSFIIDFKDDMAKINDKKFRIRYLEYLINKLKKRKE